MCERCGHPWKSGSLPVRCAKCKSPYLERTEVIEGRAMRMVMLLALK